MEGDQSSIFMAMFQQHREDINQRLIDERTHTDRRFGELAEHVGTLTKEMSKLTSTIANQQGAHRAWDALSHKGALIFAALAGVALDHVWHLIF